MDGGPTPDERARMARHAQAFLDATGVPGLGFAAGHGSAVFEAGYGCADARGTPVRPTHRLRIASLAKPVTALAAMALVQSGALRLDARVFGPGAVLGHDYGRRLRPGIGAITVAHLLTHTAGGWPNDHRDPMFGNPWLDQQALIAWTIDRRALDHPPGKHFAYSNFGYCVLGRAIERATGLPYTEAVAALLLRPLGIAGMAIAGNAGGAADEVAYHGAGQDPYALNVARMDSHGGWIARAGDLVRLMLGVGRVLEPATVAEMLAGSRANPAYVKGWALNRFGEWWHAGRLAGTTAVMLRGPRLCWAILANGSLPGRDLSDPLKALARALVAEVAAWRDMR